MAHCIGLGIYRRKAFTAVPKLCPWGHAIAGDNITYSGGYAKCRKCAVRNTSRCHWAELLGRYWQSADRRRYLIGSGVSPPEETQKDGAAAAPRKKKTANRAAYQTPREELASQE